MIEKGEIYIKGAEPRKAVKIGITGQSGMDKTAHKHRSRRKGVSNHLHWPEREGFSNLGIRALC